MSNCNNSCSELLVAPYRVVQNIQERNTIPCYERVKGMIVIVINDTIPFTQYILKDGDPCLNTGWVNYSRFLIELTSLEIEKVVNEIVLTSLKRAIEEHFRNNPIQVPIPSGNHLTIDNSSVTNVTSQWLNENYGDKPEGYRIHFTNQKTTYTKIQGNRWVMTNNTDIRYYE